MKSMVHCLLSLFVLILALVSCNLENFEPLSDLHPPLDLQAASSNNQVFLSFWGANNEDYFSGYNVLIGDSEATVQSLSYWLSNQGSLPYYSLSPFTYATRFTLTVSNDYDGSSLVSGQTRYFAVTAWDSRNNTNSRTSEIVSIQVSN